MSRSKSPKARAATLADVGREAGVSVMAVSAVINGARTSSRISEDTRTRILAAAKRLKYRPNAAARALVDRRMNTVGVVTLVDRGELNHYFVNLFNGILETAAQHQQNTTVFALEDWHANAHRLNSICDGRIDGVILLAPQFSVTDEISLPEHAPFVTIHSNLDIPGSINLETDEELGAEKMTRYLIEKGHRRIMHVSGLLDFRGAQRRLRGYQKALADAGIPYDPDLLISADFTSDSAQEALHQWMVNHAGKPLPQALFCSNDAMAIGCMAALAEFGVSIPEHCSVAGFDDIILCRSTIPPLTTVAQPLKEMGRQATEILLALIDGKRSIDATKTENVISQTELVIRGSVGTAPSEDFIIPARSSQT